MHYQPGCAEDAPALFADLLRIYSFNDYVEYTPADNRRVAERIRTCIAGFYPYIVAERWALHGSCLFTVIWNERINGC